MGGKSVLLAGDAALPAILALDFQEGRIEIKTVDDLRKLIEMDLELRQGSLLNGRRMAMAVKAMRTP